MKPGLEAAKERVMGRGLANGEVMGNVSCSSFSFEQGRGRSSNEIKITNASQLVIPGHLF